MSAKKLKSEFHNYALSWNLNSLLENKTYEELEQTIYDFQKSIIELYRQGIFDNLENFTLYHGISLQLTCSYNRIANYLSNKTNVDLSNTTWFEKSQKLELNSKDYCETLSSFELDALDHQSQIEFFLKHPSFFHLTRMYQRIFDSKPHLLERKISKFLVSFEPLDSSFYTLFTLLEKDLNAMPVKDGKSSKVAIPNYSKFIELQKQHNRTLRKNSFLSWHTAVFQNRDLFSRLLHFNCLEREISSKNINFSGGYYEACCFADEIPLNLVPHIYKEISRWKNVFRSVLRAKKRALKSVHGWKTVKPWDLRMELDISDREYSVEEASNLAIESLDFFLGKEYGNRVREALDSNWIDWLPAPNKMTGEYCISGTYSLPKKFILLNYNKKLSDVFTLVHELGHAIHATFYDHQKVYAGTSIFIAEIPSMLNELLLFEYLRIKLKDQNELKKLYHEILQSFVGSTANQVIFSEFEYSISDVVNKGGIVEPNMAFDLYSSLRTKYLGSKPPKSSQEWARYPMYSILTIPHFYSNNFYVYKYTVGQVVAVTILKQIKKDKGYLEKYFEFLASGRSLSNLDTLKLLGVDLMTSDIWQESKEYLCELLSEYEAITRG